MTLSTGLGAPCTSTSQCTGAANYCVIAPGATAELLLDHELHGRGVHERVRVLQLHGVVASEPSELSAGRVHQGVDRGHGESPGLHMHVIHLAPGEPTMSLLRREPRWMRRLTGIGALLGVLLASQRAGAQATGGPPPEKRAAGSTVRLEKRSSRSSKTRSRRLVKDRSDSGQGDRRDPAAGFPPRRTRVRRSSSPSGGFSDPDVRRRPLRQQLERSVQSGDAVQRDLLLGGHQSLREERNDAQCSRRSSRRSSLYTVPVGANVGPEQRDKHHCQPPEPSA